MRVVFIMSLGERAATEFSSGEVHSSSSTCSTFSSALLPAAHTNTINNKQIITILVRMACMCDGNACLPAHARPSFSLCVPPLFLYYTAMNDDISQRTTKHLQQ